MPTIESLPTADITVQYVNPPKEDGKNGSVKASDGTYYYVRPEMLGQFSRNMKCKVEYRASPKKDGSGEWRTVTKIVGNQSAPTVPKNDYRARSNPAEAKQIAVLALAKECIGRLTYEQLCTDELVAILTMCSQAYDRTLGGVQAQRRDDMNDEVPY